MLRQIQSWRIRAALSTLLLLPFAGCSPNQDPQVLKERTARTTAELKRDAKAVASGIREGWSRDKPLDLNSATKEQLRTLPGLTVAEANRIVANRPYNKPDDLITRHIMPKSEYDKIADRVTAKK